MFALSAREKRLQWKTVLTLVTVVDIYSQIIKQTFFRAQFCARVDKSQHCREYITWSDISPLYSYVPLTVYYYIHLPLLDDADLVWDSKYKVFLMRTDYLQAFRNSSICIILNMPKHASQKHFFN